MTTYRINAPHFCAGLVVTGNLVIQSAPVLHWTVGRDFSFVRTYCEQRGWTVEPVTEDSRPQWLEAGDRLFELHWQDQRIVRISEHRDGDVHDVAFTELPEVMKEAL